MTRSAAPACLIKPVPIVLKNPRRMNMPYPKAHPLTRRLLLRPRRKRQKQRKRRPLRFSPYAWAKLIYLRDRGPTEVGGFGITDAADPKFVTDIVLIKQTCTDMTVVFDDTAVADFFDDQIDAGRHPENFGRIWIHTHPGFSARPSQVDVETFARVFGNCDWAVMFILARNGATYAELKHAGRPMAEKMSVGIDFKPEFAASNRSAWEAEYLQSVREEPLPPLWNLTDWFDDEFVYSEQWPVFPI
jgi:proteasome lid subunit RPN8/RPN11